MKLPPLKSLIFTDDYKPSDFTTRIVNISPYCFITRNYKTFQIIFRIMLKTYIILFFLPTDTFINVNKNGN